jgi:hypothetical protein
MAETPFNMANGLAAVDSVLQQEANRIGSDIYNATIHTSPWLDLVKQTPFPDGQGYQLTTLIYDRAVATKIDNADAATDVEGVDWNDLGGTISSGESFNATTKTSGPYLQGRSALNDTTDETMGARGVDGSNDLRSAVQFAKKLKAYNLKRAVIESPRISLEDLRFAAHRQDQLRAIMDTMTQVTRYAWENRYRDEFSRVANSYIGCVASGTAVQTGFEGYGFEGTDASALDLGSSGSMTVPTANISNAALDKAYFNLIRQGAGNNSYGRENGRPVFALVLSSEASYQLQTEAGFRDDVRYNNAKVSDLIAPLGIEKSFRGFYHIVDDLAPRFTLANTDQLTRVLPYTVSSGLTSVNNSYDTASYEAAFILHPEVLESQIPNPMTGAGKIKFNPVNYRGEFSWKNILSEATNPDGTIGFFRGVMANATKPIKTDFGFVIIFKRDSTTPAA